MVAPGVVHSVSRSHHGRVTEQPDQKPPKPRRLEEIFGPDPVVGVPAHESSDTDRDDWYQENRPPHHESR